MLSEILTRNQIQVLSRSNRQKKYTRFASSGSIGKIDQQLPYCEIMVPQIIPKLQATR